MITIELSEQERATGVLSDENRARPSRHCGPTAWW